MPATAGRVRMPANNRVHSSAALQTHGIWQSAIGYDPYAPTAKDDGKKASTTSKVSDSAEPEPENAYASFQGLLALARITNSNSDEARGSCKKCGRVGHLTFQCRNFLSVREDVNRGGNVDDDVIREVVLEKLKGEKVKGLVKKVGLESGESSEDEEEEEEDSESSDSDYDSEMERIIAEKYGKKVNGKAKVGSRRKAEEDDDNDEDEEDMRKRRGRSRKRRNRKRENNDSEDEERRRRKRKKERRNRDDDESSDEEDESKRRKKRKSRKERRRRRSHRHSSDYSDASPEDSGDRRRKRRSRRTASTSDSDDTGSDDPRVGRDKRRSEKKSRKSRHGD
ncbi:CAX-interacting protein 4 [Coffea arabica]|uniref:CAX-interacting protein 4 n=1 Tax=Coffea arabica TaxID=13443 RepID=A0A6P6W1M1_COFAR|nr:CAX-interacting protein 4-like [Coffea arabica]